MVFELSRSMELGVMTTVGGGVASVVTFGDSVTGGTDSAVAFAALISGISQVITCSEGLLQTPSASSGEGSNGVGSIGDGTKGISTSGPIGNGAAGTSTGISSPSGTGGVHWVGEIIWRGFGGDGRMGMKDGY